MSPSQVSFKRLHILYTTPLILGLISVFLVWIALFGLVPWKRTPATVLMVEQSESRRNASQPMPTLYFGLLGSCYKSNPSSPLECTHPAFPPDYASTMARAENKLNVDHLQISMPDLPPVFLVWSLVSLISLMVHLLAVLPLYAPAPLYHVRFTSRPLFSAALWILGIAWAFGFSAVLALACFIEGFGTEYNQFSIFYVLNHAHGGSIFWFLVPPLVFQILMALSLLVAIENAPTRDKEAFSDSWNVNMRAP